MPDLPSPDNCAFPKIPSEPPTTPAPKSPPPTPSENRSDRIFFVLGIFTFLIIVAATAIAAAAISKLPKTAQEQKINLATAPSPSSAPVFDRSLWTFEIVGPSNSLNSQIVTKLDSLGYRTVATKTTKQFATSSSLLYIHPTLIDRSDQLLADIGQIFSVSSVSGDLLDSTATARLVIPK
jgi:hypothetical protein